jgi:hypothetical protein
MRRLRVEEHPKGNFERIPVVLTARCRDKRETSARLLSNFPFPNMRASDLLSRRARAAYLENIANSTFGGVIISRAMYGALNVAMPGRYFLVPIPED